MHKKKHHQFKGVTVNHPYGLRVGGVVIPSSLSYYGGGYGGSMSVAGHSESAENAQSEAQEAASGMSEAGEATGGATGGGDAGGGAAGGGASGGAAA
jgi:hypothetical protein